MHIGSTSTVSLRGVLLGVAAMGVDVRPVLAELDVDTEMLADRDARVPASLMLRAWRLCAERSGDPFLGLRLAQRFQPGAFDVVDCVARAAADLAEGLRRFVRYQRLLDDSVEVTMDDEGPHVAIAQRHEIPPHMRVRHAPECFFALLLVRGRQLTGRAWSPVEMRFRHARPEDTAEHERLFACPVRFAQPTATMVVSREVLALPVVGADPVMASVLGRYADELLARLPKEEDLVTRTRRATAEALRSGGDPGLAAIASRLGVTPRTLQRRLADEGVVHRTLLDEIRRDIGVTHAAGDLAFDEIAFLLGFSEISAFYRAFKRWTGTTPAEYRAARKRG